MANGVRSAIAQAAALSHYLTARVFGVLVTYSSRGGAGVQVYAIPQYGTATMRVTLGSRVREVANFFEIAMQPPGPNPTFPPAAGIMEDDTITDDQGVTYAIRVDDPDDLNAVTRFSVVATIPKQSGQVGQ